jgi:hypothetical protein
MDVSASDLVGNRASRERAYNRARGKSGANGALDDAVRVVKVIQVLLSLDNGWHGRNVETEAVDWVASNA